jgi:hypothetical protein
MSNLIMQKNKWIFRFGVTVVLALLLIYLQMSLTKVSADLKPVSVNIGHLEFGTVFPGQVLENYFTVSYGDNSGLDSNYRIIQMIKPHPGAVVPEGYTGTMREYCQANPSDNARCYKNLCPYLTKLSHEGEGDVEAGAAVGPEDLHDNWTVHLEVPAIIGNVAQDHKGGLVSVSGEYGCDISIDVLGD